MIREPAFSNQFYSSNFTELEKEIFSYFEESKFGPGSLPNKKRNKRTRAIIVPHAGFVFSGACAAWAYKELAESDFPECYIIFGVDHQGLGSSVSTENWKTPFGVVKTHEKFAKELIATTGINSENYNHRNEHSIEVQLPFLQFISREYLEKLRIIAITVGRDIDIKKTAQHISEFIKNKNIKIIVSSDFTHYGPNYGYVPFKNPETELKKFDLSVIDFIKNLDADGFSEHVKKTKATICGEKGIELLLRIMKKPSVKILMYYSSGNISKDFSNSVGYAAILFD